MPTPQIRNHQSANSFHAFILIVGMLLILGVNGFLLYGWVGLGIALGLAVGSILLGSRVSPRIVLRMYRARPILNHSAPQLYEIFHRLCQEAKLDPMPGLFYIPSKVPNAFAVGHDETAAVAVTDGLLRIMNPRELEGILAHEVAHLEHRDTHVMGLADTLSRLTTLLSRIGLILMFFSLASAFAGGDALWFLIRGFLLFLSPSISLLLQFALSRSREFNADLGAVRLTGDPYGLASALERLDRLSDHLSFWQRVLTPQRVERQPAFLRTHPDTEERIQILLELTSAQDLRAQKMRECRTEMRRQKPRHVTIGFQPRVRRKPRYHIMSGIFK